jgi:hypothetical protein
MTRRATLSSTLPPPERRQRASATKFQLQALPVPHQVDHTGGGKIQPSIFGAYGIKPRDARLAD